MVLNMKVIHRVWICEYVDKLIVDKLIVDKLIVDKLIVDKLIVDM